MVVVVGDTDEGIVHCDIVHAPEFRYWNGSIQIPSTYTGAYDRGYPSILRIHLPNATTLHEYYVTMRIHRQGMDLPVLPIRSNHYFPTVVLPTKDDPVGSGDVGGSVG